MAFDRDRWSERAKAAFERFEKTTLYPGLTYVTFAEQARWVTSFSHLDGENPILPPIGDELDPERVLARAALFDLWRELAGADLDDFLAAWPWATDPPADWSDVVEPDWRCQSRADRLFLAFDLQDEPSLLNVLPAWMLRTPDGWQDATDSYGEEAPRSRVLRRLFRWIAGEYGRDVATAVPCVPLHGSCADVASAVQAALL